MYHDQQEFGLSPQALTNTGAFSSKVVGGKWVWRVAKIAKRFV